MAEEKKEAPPKTQGQIVQDLVMRYEGDIAQALPRFIDAETFTRTALTMVKQSPKLMQCSQASLIISLLRAAAVGLPPDGILGLAFLIPRQISRQLAGGKWTKVWEAGFQIGYQGWLELARRSGEVSYIAARVVRERDEWEPPSYSLHKDDFKHVPFFGEGDPGKVIGAYGVVRFRNGEANSLALPLSRIYAEHRKFSMAYDPEDKKCPWVAHEEQMIQKTMLTAICKHAPKSAELRAAASLDDREDRGIGSDDEATLRQRLTAGGGGTHVLDISSFVEAPVVDAGEKDPPEDAPDLKEKKLPADEIAQAKAKKAAVAKPEEKPRPTPPADVPPEDREVMDMFGPAE